MCLWSVKKRQNVSAIGAQKLKNKQRKCSWIWHQHKTRQSRRKWEKKRTENHHWPLCAQHGNAQRKCVRSIIFRSENEQSSFNVQNHFEWIVYIKRLFCRFRFWFFDSLFYFSFGSWNTREYVYCLFSSFEIKELNRCITSRRQIHLFLISLLAHSKWN